MQKHRFPFLVLIIVALVSTLGSSAFAGENSQAWGAQAAAADKDKSIVEMLRYAIEDEYLAHAEYLSIMRRHGEIRPFSNIAASEVSHISWLQDAFKAAGLPVPEDRGAEHVIPAETLKAAFQAGVAAEIDNIGMYDSFLASTLMAKPENAALKSLFVRLRDASKNHLAAFRNGLSKY